MYAYDTIAAIASAPGPGARGIVRISGHGMRACLEACFRFYEGLPASVQARVVPGSMQLPGFAAPLPCDLYLWPTRRSYTAAPTAEIHTLGSPPLLEAVLRAVCAAGARLAAPGEFTLRAFLAGRLDLTQAEAVLGVIDAADRRELQVALEQLAGGLSQPLHDLRSRLLDLLAELEAGLDFAEEDIRFISPDELLKRLEEAADALARLEAQMAGRGQSADAMRVVLMGWPNVGKSSLFNAFAGHGAALVSDVPGTTRDYLTAWIDLGGARCQLIDTAGAEPGEVPGSLGSAAQQMTSQQREQAHVRVLCLDASRPLNDGARAEVAAGHSDLLVLTKCDRPRQIDLAGVRTVPIETSSVTGAGLELLRSKLQEMVTGSPAETRVVSATAVRCQESLRLAGQSLQRAHEIAASQDGEELVASELRGALAELGKVAGAVYADDILDRIFSRFCIGK